MNDIPRNSPNTLFRATTNPQFGSTPSAPPLEPTGAAGAAGTTPIAKQDGGGVRVCYTAYTFLCFVSHRYVDILVFDSRSSVESSALPLLFVHPSLVLRYLYQKRMAAVVFELLSSPAFAQASRVLSVLWYYPTLHHVFEGGIDMGSL